MTSLRKLADHLGISVAMVSRALSGAPGISNANRQRVCDAANELGYRANPLGSRLMSHYRKQEDSEGMGTLALLTATGWRKEQCDGPLGEFLDGVHETAKRSGFSVDRLAMKDFSPKRLEQVMLNRGIRGAIIAPSLETTSETLPFLSDQLTCVLTGWGWSGPAYHRVAADHGQAVLIALEQARLRCGSRIAAFFNPSTNERARKVPSAVFLANHPMGYAKASRLLFWNTPTQQSRLQNLLSTDPPDALLVSNPSLLNGLEGVSGSPLSCISLDGALSNSLIGYIDQKYRLIGSWAVEMLLSSLFLSEKGLPSDQKVLLVEPQWKEDHSVF